MLLEHAEDLSAFLSELQRETDRGLPLVGAALIDEKLLRTLEAFFVKSGKCAERLLNSGNAPLSTFSARADACHALGLIDDFEYSEIVLIRKIRNEFAHSKHGTSFASDRISGLCTSLKSPLPEGGPYDTGSARFMLTNAILCVALRLYYRPEWVEKERREPKKWVPDSRWYDTNKNPPPEGVGFIGLHPVKADKNAT